MAVETTGLAFERGQATFNCTNHMEAFSAVAGFFRHVHRKRANEKMNIKKGPKEASGGFLELWWVKIFPRVVTCFYCHGQEDMAFLWGRKFSPIPQNFT
jgi:hypothetical protein